MSPSPPKRSLPDWAKLTLLTLVINTSFSQSQECKKPLLDLVPHRLQQNKSRQYLPKDYNWEVLKDYLRIQLKFKPKKGDVLQALNTRRIFTLIKSKTDWERLLLEFAQTASDQTPGEIQLKIVSPKTKKPVVLTPPESPEPDLVEEAIVRMVEAGYIRASLKKTMENNNKNSFDPSPYRTVAFPSTYDVVTRFNQENDHHMKWEKNGFRDYPNLGLQLGIFTEVEYEQLKLAAMKPAEVEEEEEEYSINKAEDIDFGMANPDVVDSYLGSCNTGNNEAEWHGCLDFFRINVDEYNRQIASKSADSQHVRVPFKKFPGMTVGLFDYQLMGVYTLIKFLLDDVSGGFLCDEQGLGKTQEMFGLIALAHNLRRCKTEVHEFWSPPKTSAQKKRPATVRHNLKTDLGAQSCPYDQKYGFRCYCYNEPTRQIADRLPDGPNLFIAPAKNCAPMIREAKTKLDTKTLKIRGYGKDVDKDNQLSTRDIALLHASIRPKQKPGKTDFEYTYQAPTGQSHYLIFVSPQSIDKLNSEFNILVKGKKKSALLPGMIMLDEFHEYALTPESRTLAWLNHLKKCTLTSQQPTPLVYFVSGTPIDHSPADLAPAISHLESSTWSKPTHPLHPASRSQLQSLLTNFSTYTALQSAGSTIPPNQVKAYYTHLSQILTHLMIRRLVTDSFLTRPLTTLGPLKISIITHSIPTKYLPAITALQSSFSPTPSLPLLLSSTFPALLSDPSHTKFTFLPSEPLSFPLKPLHSPYTPHISTWTTSSPKLLSLTTTLKSMLSDTSPIPNSASSLKKLCLFSPHESETLILFLYLSTHLKLPSLKPIYLHPALSQPDKQKIIDSFLKEGNGTPNVLVSSFASGGTGLNLQRANYLVVTGPGFTKRETAQVFGRVHRVGQKCGRVRLEMLVTTGHEGEEKVLEGWGSGIGGLRRVQEKEVPEEK